MIFVAVGWRRKIPMPWLVFCALKRNVEADLHDLITRSKNRFTHSDNPRMREELNETAERLRMGFDIPAPWSSTHCPAGSLNCVPERAHHVFANLLHPFA
jgi:hypothetical protein